MVKFNYLKYSTFIRRYIDEADWGVPTEIETISIKGTIGLSINDDKTFSYYPNTAGSQIDLAKEPIGTTVYSGTAYTAERYISKAYSEKYSPGVIADKYTVSRNLVKEETKRNQYIETVVAEDGTLPNNGIHTDNYWYVKSEEFNEPPSVPTIVSPIGGEIITTAHTIKWIESTDINNDAITYQIELTTNNGKNWTRIADNRKGNQFLFGFANLPDTSVAKIRIRAFDGVLYSDWAESEEVFTINFNYPPNPPYNLSPFGGQIVDSEKTVRFQWTHSDPNGSDPQSKFELRWRQVGETTWNVISETTTRQYQDIHSNTITTGNIEWQVRTYDQAGLVSEWSNIVIFTSAKRPETALWLYPTNGLKVTEAIPTFQWSSNVQTAYRVILFDENDFILWDTDDIEGITKAVTCGVTLEDGGIYSVSVLIRNAENFWSEEEKITFTTSYSAPTKPNLTLFDSGASITVQIDNPESAGLEPQTVRNEIYKFIDKEWVRIAKDIPPNGAFIDYTARSKYTEVYRVKAIGDNEGIQYSENKSLSISFRGVYIHDVQDPELTIKHFLFNGGSRTSNLANEYALMQFKGRKTPVVEFAESVNKSVSVTLQLLKTDDLLALEDMVTSRNTLCFRDARGRLLFGFIPSVPATDEFYGHEVQIEFIGIDYKGSV